MFILFVPSNQLFVEFFAESTFKGPAELLCSPETIKKEASDHRTVRAEERLQTSIGLDTFPRTIITPISGITCTVCKPLYTGSHWR